MEEKLREYAGLLVEAGANPQKGQALYIYAAVECADLARLCAEAAYDRGAREVVMVWSDDVITRLRYLRAEEDVFDQMPEWQAELYAYQMDQNAAKLVLYGSDPALLRDADPVRIQRWQQVTGARLRRYNEAQMANRFQWCIGGYATKAWASRVFPALGEDAAVARLWDAIFQATRVAGDGGAVGRWQEFVNTMRARVDRLNGLRLRALHYQNALGTSLTLELPEGHYWSGASEKTPSGVSFLANIPSEEIFTLPKRDGVNGIVYASKPLALNGNVVDGIRMTIRDGRIVEAEAAVGEAFLKKALETDDGAAYLGEVALVPYDSPISNSGILFYNTLFDENAACHFAFGEAYPMIHGAASLPKEEKLALGINQSYVHEDFMVGTSDLSITGETWDGQTVSIFTNGNFAF